MTSHANRPGAARRTPDGQAGRQPRRGCAVAIPRPPDQQPGAEAHAALAHVVDACSAPQCPRSGSCGGTARCSVRETGRPRATQARPAADRRQPCTGVGAPAGAQQRPSGHAELDHADAAPRGQRRGQLAHRRRRVLDVAQQVSKRERVELAVGERQPLRLALDQVHVRAKHRIGRQAGARPREHALALIKADDFTTAAPHQLGGDHPGAGGNIEHALIGPRRQPLNQCAAPARVLAEAHHRPHRGRNGSAGRRTARARGACATTGLRQTVPDGRSRDPSPVANSMPAAEPGSTGPAFACRQGRRSLTDGGLRAAVRTGCASGDEPPGRELHREQAEQHGEGRDRRARPTAPGDHPRAPHEQGKQHQLIARQRGQRLGRHRV